MPSYFTSWRSILILSSHLWLGRPTKITKAHTSGYSVHDILRKYVLVMTSLFLSHSHKAQSWVIQVYGCSSIELITLFIWGLEVSSHQKCEQGEQKSNLLMKFQIIFWFIDFILFIYFTCH
jgi:hypothetical protein